MTDQIKTVTTDEIVEAHDQLKAAKENVRAVAKKGNEEIEACREEFKETIEASRSSESKTVVEIISDYDAWQARKKLAKEENDKARSTMKEAKTLFEQLLEAAKQPSLPFVE